ncbi:hypothetical protein D3C86_1832650 [compost metagenome]
MLRRSSKISVRNQLLNLIGVNTSMEPSFRVVVEYTQKLSTLYELREKFLSRLRVGFFMCLCGQLLEAGNDTRRVEILLDGLHHEYIVLNLCGIDQFITETI